MPSFREMLVVVFLIILPKNTHSTTTKVNMHSVEDEIRDSDSVSGDGLYSNGTSRARLTHGWLPDYVSEWSKNEDPWWSKRGGVFGILHPEWTLPDSCIVPNAEPTYNIVLHFVNNWETNDPFPEKMKAPIQAAADWWSRAIVGSKQSQAKRLRTQPWNIYPGMTIGSAIFSTRTRKLHQLCGGLDSFTEDISIGRDSILICVHYIHFFSDTIALAGNLANSSVTQLPMLAVIVLNKKYEGALDDVDWTNVAAHEIAHALGFTSSYGYVSTGSNPGISQFANGTKTKAEWDRLIADKKGSTKDTTPARPLLTHDGSHWSDRCLPNDLMTATYTARYSRAPMSRVTLAVMEDIGYEVNYACADPSKRVNLQLDTCTIEHRPTPLRRHLYNTPVRFLGPLWRRLKRSPGFLLWWFFCWVILR